MQKKRNSRTQIEDQKMLNCQLKNKLVLSNKFHKGSRVLKSSKKAKGTDIVDVDETMDIHFLDEILMDILSRLPVRSLLRFKGVSKLWKTLINEPLFKVKHLNHAKNDQNSQKFLFYRRPMESMFSIHSCSLSSAELVEDAQTLSMESINRRINSPSHSRISNGGISFYGMSFDSNSNDYKILKILNYGSDEPSEILALKSGSWRKIVEHPRVTDNMLLDMHSLTCIHGEFHWVGFSRNYFVVSFDISHEVYGEIPLPECLSNIGDIGISELEGMLCAYSNVYHHGRHTYKLWVMKDYGLKESLNALFSIENPNVIMPIPKYRFANGEVLFWCVYSQVPENAYWT
ncbi:hypothetical protein BC332_29888 [Capsicum chinense]|nr:hypothetical protein BC332_29888 [Capsicum chinense]